MSPAKYAQPAVPRSLTYTARIRARVATGGGYLRNRANRLDPESLSRKPWFPIKQTFEDARAEKPIDFMGTDDENVTVNAIRDVIKNNDEVGEGYEKHTGFPGFPIQLVMPNNDCHPLI